MSRLMQGVHTLRDLFDEYASGDPKALTKRDLSDLLHEEITDIDVESRVGLSELFSELDGDGDGVVDFIEFASFLARIQPLLD